LSGSQQDDYKNEEELIEKDSNEEKVSNDSNTLVSLPIPEMFERVIENEVQNALKVSKSSKLAALAPTINDASGLRLQGSDNRINPNKKDGVGALLANSSML
jgi:hypothetical protein